MIEASYANLQQQIADECGDRQDLLAVPSGEALVLSPIRQAIESAIAKWERKPFYFNEYLVEVPNGLATYPLKTAAGQEYYGASITTQPQYQGTAASPVDWADFPSLVMVKRVWVLVSANRYEVRRRTNAYSINISVNPSVTGEPTEYTYVNEMLRMYPIPNGAYPIGMLGLLRFPALTAPSDFNPWTEDAYDLIRSEAKMILFRDVIKRPDQVEACKLAIYGDGEDRRQGYLYDLEKETRARKSGGGGAIRPTYF